MPKGCIIYCIEQGVLERLTLLSIASIRRFGGALNQFDIFCMQPRDAFRVSSYTKEKLKEFNATFIDYPLNVKYKYYALANKPLVCEYIIEHHNYDQYLFLDSDTIVVADPTKYFSKSVDIMLSPVNTKGVGIANFGDTNSAYWISLFEMAGVDLETLPKIETEASKEKIISYWNSGVLLFNGQTSICNKWKKLLYEILTQKIYPESGIYFAEQTCLTAVLSRGSYKVDILPKNCNFPILSNKVSGLKTKDPVAIIHHYHNLDQLEDQISDLVKSDKIDWIQEKIDGLSINPKNFHHRLVMHGNQCKKKLMEKMYYFISKFSSS